MLNIDTNLKSASTAVYSGFNVAIFSLEIFEALNLFMYSKTLFR
jgi:hypothetical protein